MEKNPTAVWKPLAILLAIGFTVWLILTKPWERIEVVQRCAHCAFECKETGMMVMHLYTEHGCKRVSGPTVSYERIDRERIKMVQTWRCKEVA